jgi:hypothetical protein
MPSLRVLSWNIRAFGSHPKNDEDIYRIADIILNSQADIVCIQELMIGRGVIGEVGADISQGSFDIIMSILGALAMLDEAAQWWGTVSGVNSHVRDAYAFLWKQTSSPIMRRRRATASPRESVRATALSCSNTRIVQAAAGVRLPGV